MEIEHKYLVTSTDFLQEASHSYYIEQGYLSTSSPTIRVRRRDDEGFITVKGPSDRLGLMRDEWEYSIPVSDALAMLGLCGGRTLSKRRYIVPYEGNIWEVDVFEGRHSGLILAEIEVEHIDATFSLPPWVGEEVSADPRYRNATLARITESPRSN